jgi:hypothetical protein
MCFTPHCWPFPLAFVGGGNGWCFLSRCAVRRPSLSIGAGHGLLGQLGQGHEGIGPGLDLEADASEGVQDSSSIAGPHRLLSACDGVSGALVGCQGIFGSGAQG